MMAERVKVMQDGLTTLNTQTGDLAHVLRPSPAPATGDSGATVPASSGTSSGYSGGASGTSAAATSSHRKPVPDYLQSDYSGDATAAAMYASANDYNNDYTPSSSGSYGGASNSGNSANFADIIGAALGWGNNNGAGYGAGNGLGGYGGNNGGYTGGGNGGGTTGGYVGTMRDAYDAQAKARADALEQLIASYDGQQAQMNQQYDQAVRDAYANARLSAIGNNELLAAQGLAGGLYQTPRSGYSETSRVMQDNAMRTNIANAQLARAQASQEVARDIAQLRAQGLYEQADLAASQAEALINLQMQLDEQQYQRELDAWNMQQAERNNA